jgi:membrane associated rhomboid family serine protease
MGAPSTSTTCYRHPDTPTGRRCTRCGKPACNRCLTKAAVGSHCVDCAKAAQPDLKTRAKFWSTGQPNLVTMVLIGLNIAVFVGILLWTRDPGALTGSTDAHLQLAVGRDVLAYPINWAGEGVTQPNEWYRLVTSGFTHYGIIHLALNMYFLYVLGPLLEPQLGRARFLLLYMASLLGGSLGAILLSPSSLTAGASGAVFGLMAAASVGLWRRGVNPFSTSIGQILLLNLFLTFVISGISIGGHLGGAIAGAICATVMLAPSHQPAKTWATYALPIAVALISIVASVLVVGAA